MNEKSKTEALVILQEECAEVIQAISKIHRFGINSISPIHPYESNKTLLHKEVGDLLCMIVLCIENGILEESIVNEYIEKKREKLKTWSNIKIKD